MASATVIIQTFVVSSVTRTGRNALNMARNMRDYVKKLQGLISRTHGTGSVWSPYQFEKSQDEHDS